jgi:beta-glucosidase
MIFLFPLDNLYYINTMKKRIFRISTVSLVLAISLIACSLEKKELSMAEKEEAKEKALYAKIDSLIKLMTLEEKVKMIHGASSFTNGGIPRLKIPEIVMSDGPHGVRHEHNRDWSRNEKINYKVTYLPTGISLAATWNPELGYKFGEVLGSEAKKRGKDIILGPGINIIRTPLNGRNFEYMTEDPYLNSVMAVGYIKGVQDQGISACVKHYAANNQETKRAEVNVIMSERALREIYLPGFKAAVQDGGVYTVMGAYNKFRGQYCAHNEYLINKVLKGEFGFKGALISDWSAVMNTMQALKYGTDIEMGTDMRNWGKWNYDIFFMADTAIKLVKAGIISESLIDEKVRRILWVMFKANIFGTRTPGEVNTEAHQQAARTIAEEAIVLLKNDNILPLNNATLKSIAVIGENAIRKHAEAGGSSQVPALYEITPLAGLKNLLKADSSIIKFAQGYEAKKGGLANPKLIAEAVKAAKASEIAIVFGGYIHGYSDSWDDIAYDGEGIDKPNIILPFGQDELIKAVIKANPKTIVVLLGGGASDMTLWVNDAKAIVQAWYPGMEGGNAIANILFGKVNPSGKLPVTFPKKLNDIGAHALGEYPGDTVVHYNEGIFVGYRYLDTYKVEPLFAFGHGLSYTKFDYSNILVNKEGEGATVKLTLKNSGSVAGAEVVQIYVSDEKASVERPQQELKAFQKIFLNPGESKEVTLTLKKGAFQYFDEKKMDWVLEPGKFIIRAGSSSRDIRLMGEIIL